MQALLNVITKEQNINNAIDVNIEDMEINGL